MNQPITMNPDLVYQLVASNPNLKNIVEQTARLMQIQQQMTPTLQQMASNPMAAVNSYVDWQGQQMSQQQQVQPQAAQQPQQQQTQQGGQAVGPYEQAMKIVEEFRKNFEVMNNNLKEVYDMSVSNAEAIKALNGKNDGPLETKGAVRSAQRKEQE